VLGFSNKTYVEAFANEQLEHWIAGHCHAFNFFGGLTCAVVIDYVARHRIGILFPARICALKRGKALHPRALAPPPGT
jgi:hypothetical protein